MKDGNYTVPCPLWPDNTQRCEVVQTVKRIVATLSIIGCLGIVLIIWLFKYYKYQVQRLTMYLSISAGLSALMYLVGEVYHNDAGCKASSFLMQYADWATLLWVSTISFNMVLITRSVSTVTWEKYYHMFCWLLPLVWASIPIQHYGPAGLWCWIQRDAPQYRFATWYIPFFVLLFVLVAVNVYVIRTVAKEDGNFAGFYSTEENHANRLLAKEVKPLVAFPFIYLFVSIPNLIYRIQDFVNPDELPSYPLSILNVLFVPSMGAVNAIAYSLYTDTHKQLTWHHIKGAFHTRFSSDAVGITHNIDVQDAEDQGAHEI